MKKILLVIFPAPTGTWGSMTRMMALAKKFTIEGHSVAFCASNETAARLAEKGYIVYPMPETTLLNLPKPISKRISQRSQRARIPVKDGKSFGNIWLLLFFLGFKSKAFLFRYVCAMQAACVAFGAEMIVTEMDPGAFICAWRNKLPIVSTYAKISRKGESSYFARRMEKTVRSVCHALGASNDISLQQLVFGPHILKLIPSIPELDQTPLSRDICYCGNLLEPVRTCETTFLPEPDKKYIFCYMGTGSISLEQIEEQLPKALENREDLVCYVAAQSIEQPHTIGNVRFVSYIQADEILPHCILTICHGGLNTITQSLEAGVPLFMFPGAIFERRYNAQSVAELKAGFFGETGDFNCEWIRDKIEHIDQLKEGVLTAQARFKTYHGADTAYSDIIQWFNG